MILHLTEYSQEPIHSQIQRQLLTKILDGDLAAEHPLPPPRRLAREHHVNVQAAERAYQELLHLGAIAQKSASEYRVSHLDAAQRQALLFHLRGQEHAPIDLIKAVTTQLAAVVEPQKLVDIIAEQARRHLRIERLCVVLHDAERDAWRALPQELFDRDIVAGTDPLLHTLRQRFSPLRLAELPLTGSDLQQRLQAMKVQYLVPLHSEGRFLGVMGFSEKMVEADLSFDERLLLNILAGQFVAAVRTSTYYAEALEKRRIEDEMQTAQKIQSELLPKRLPANEFVELAAFIAPSRLVGGDFYDVIELDTRRFVVVVSDASGKGMPAALLMAQLQAMLRSELKHSEALAIVLERINHQLFRSTAADKFATLLAGLYDAATGTMQLVNAGHNYPILAGGRGQTRQITGSGPALGLLPASRYSTQTLQLEPGDTLLFYTDGVSETMRSDGEQYSEAQLTNVLAQHRSAAPAAIVEHILADVDAFAGGNLQQDDRTILVCRIHALATGAAETPKRKSN